ncbi:MAG: helix-hairpin-helix domain-containing protein [Bacteroidaceae bacterium]|nr:helix-hairpin-helix domain-containing protein [Bacteroidaceae bacterium]
MKRLLYTLLYIGLFIPSAFCQTEQEEAKVSWEDFVEWMTEENGEDGTVDETLMEQLYELHGNPLDINEVRKEDLEVLPFLNEEQIEGIVRYVEKNRPVQSLGELMFVKELGKRGRELLRLFVEVKEGASWHDDIRNMGKLLKYGRNEAVWRTDVPFYRKAGYEDVAAKVLEKSPNKVYRGDRFHHAFRYAFSSKNHLLAGLNMEKDAGERGVDYVSGYVQVKDMGVVKNAIVGNYRLSFGKGLAVNTSAKFGKMMMFSSMDRMDVGIRKHSSTSEYGYFTGGAATLRFGQVEVSAFGSYRKNDGTYNNDSTGMSSLKTDGLHRTQLEHSKKGNLGTTDFGGNIHWENHDLRLSATAVATHLSVPLAPKHDTTSSIYRLYNAHGQDFFVGSLAYAYRYRSLSFSGETAMSNNEHQNGTATLNSLRWRVNGDNVLTLVGRYYGAKFVSLNGKAFGENSAVQNEEGVFLSWTTKSMRNTVVEAYVDAMYFPWLKYQVSGSSYGYEGMLQTTYSPNRRWSLLARYRIKSKQQDFAYSTGEETYKTLRYRNHQNLKLQLNCTLSSFVSLRTSVTGTLISFGDNPNEKGFAIGENLRWQNLKNKCRIDLGITYFNTDSYDARVYQYEPSLLYSFASTSYYYQGIRATLLASIPIVKQSLFINAKLGMTKYFDRESIGTGLEMINADHREDLQVQVRWKF